jgi:uncharacterized protein YfcZ (UPF0381/DUF406 family)
LAVFAILVMGLVQPVGAQVDRVSCGFFETREDAQAELDARPELAEVLDSDGNGVACEELQTGGPVVVDPVSCGFFETREDAQAELEARPELAEVLDSDGDGIACETLPSTGGPVVVVCNEASGILIEVSESALDQDSLDFPFHRATQAEITAGTCADMAPVTPVTPGGEGELDKVMELPTTGTGTSVERVQQGPLVAVLLVLTVGALGLRSRIQR